MKHSVLVTLASLLLVTACSSKKGNSHPALMAEPLVVIAHDGKGKLKDFKVIKDLENIRSITVTPPGGGQEIYVTVLGTKRHQLFQGDSCVGTRDAADARGTIEVVIENGLATSAKGDNTLSPSPLTKEALDAVVAKLADGQLLKGDNSLITY